MKVKITFKNQNSQNSLHYRLKCQLRDQNRFCDLWQSCDLDSLVSNHIQSYSWLNICQNIYFELSVVVTKKS